MEQITKNIYVETKIRGCNPGIVLTKEGSVFIDTAQWISTLLEMIAFAESKGPIRYLINTEGHIDHIFGNHWFAGKCPVIGHEKLKGLFWTVAGELDCYDYSVDVLRRQDADSLHLMPSREDYVVNYPQITFSENMYFPLGDHHFNLYYTPGHSEGQIAVHIPEERTVFVGDTVFSECQIWLHSADIDPLIDTLRFLSQLDVDHVVPGHGPVVTRAYLFDQMAQIYEWISAVGYGMAKGWSLEECIARVSFASRHPVDIGQGEMMEYIQRNNVIKCWKYLKGEPLWD